MQKKHAFLRGVVWVMCIYHIFLGITLNCPVGFIEWTTTHILGASRLPDSSALFVARMLGTYLIVLGIGMGVAAWNPVKNRALLTIGSILVILRSIQRIVQSVDLEQALGISSGNNWITIIILLAFAAVLIFFRYRIYNEMRIETT